MWPLETFFRIGMERTIPEMRGKTWDGVHVSLGGIGRKGAALPPMLATLDLPQWDAELLQAFPIDNKIIDCFHAYHFFEHISGRAVIHCLAEVQRCLKVGGVLNIVVPYYNSQLQATDLTHKTSFCEETWRNLLEDDSYNRAGSPDKWRLKVGTNVIMGVKERNLALLTQLVKE